MASGSSSQLACPSCGRFYRFKAEIAGRKAQCKCGAILRLPRTADGQIEQLAPASAKPSAKPTTPGDAGKDSAGTAPAKAAPNQPAKSPLDAVDTDPDESTQHDSASTAGSASPGAGAFGAGLTPSGDVESYDIDLDTGEGESEPSPPPKPTPKGEDVELAIDDDNHTTGDQPVTGACPSCGQDIKPTAVICLNCGFNLKEGKKIETVVEAGKGKPPAKDKKSAATAAESSDGKEKKGLMGRLKKMIGRE